jgi:hypothetical protein
MAAAVMMAVMMVMVFMFSFGVMPTPARDP